MFSISIYWTDIDEFFIVFLKSWVVYPWYISFKSNLVYACILVNEFKIFYSVWDKYYFVLFSLNLLYFYEICCGLCCELESWRDCLFYLKICLGFDSDDCFTNAVNCYITWFFNTSPSFEFSPTPIKNDSLFDNFVFLLVYCLLNTGTWEN